MTKPERKPIQVWMPGLRQRLGLGEVLKRASRNLGVKPCSGCGRRARMLDRLVVFTPPGKPRG